MSRADASLHEYMNKLRRSMDGRSASSTRPGVGGRSVYNGSRGGASAAAKKSGSTPKGNRRAEPGHPERPPSQRRWRSALDIAAHPQSEPTSEENEIFATIPTTKPMVETLELQSRALMASRTVVEELERVTTVTIPRLKKDVTEATQATKVSTEKAERLKVRLEEKQTALKAQEELNEESSRRNRKEEPTGRRL
ncbi:hypothetical protein ACSQ67_000514 [Phaseolus vulgaris]